MATATPQSSVYGFSEQARALVSQAGEEDRNRWILGSYALNNNKIYLVDYDEDEDEISTLAFNHSEYGKITSLSSCPSPKNKNWITSCSQDGIARLFNMPQIPTDEGPFRMEAAELNLELLTTLPTSTIEKDPVRGILWEPNSNLSKILSYSKKSIFVVDLEKGKMTSKISNTLPLPPNSTDATIMCGAWSPHNEKISSFGFGTSILEYDIRSNQKQVEIANSHELGIRCIDYNPNKPHNLISGGDDNMARIWDLRNTKNGPLLQVSSHTHWIWKVAYNKFHDQLVLSCSSDAQVVLHSVISVSSAPLRVYNSPTSGGEEDTESPEEIKDGVVGIFEQHEDSVYSVAWSPSDPWIFASVSFDGRIVVNQVPSDHKYKIIM